MIYREVTSPINGDNFSELDWTLDCAQSVVIFCRTINLGMRMVWYLHRMAQLKGDKFDVEKWI
jgi:hypothetical protein